MIFSSLLALLLASASLPPQNGGESELLYQVSGTTSNDQFGNAAANAGDVDGDGYDDLIVGAPGAEIAGQIFTGEAFVYSGVNGVLLHHFSGEDTYDLFGSAVSGAGDVNADGFADLVIGAHQADPGASSSTGSVYVYSGATGLLLHQFNGTYYHQDFGEGVAGLGDFNNDGFDDILIGAAPWSYASVASAFVYSGADGSLLLQVDAPSSSLEFGGSVAALGDLDGDSYPDFIVGAYRSYSHHGTAYVYSGATGVLLFEHQGEGASHRFGSSVSGAGDLDGDGVNDYLVGAPDADFVPNSQGAVYAYSGATGALLYRKAEQIVIRNLGVSVAAAGDVDGDGRDDFVSGAIWSRDLFHPGKSGAALVYSGATGALICRFNGGLDFAQFGSSVAGLGDMNGDGRSEVFVGESSEYLYGANRAGVGHLFSFQPFINTSAYSVSVATGATIQLNLDFPTAAGLSGYKVLMSLTGTDPMMSGAYIPLTQDSYLRDSYLGTYPFSAFNNLHGTLDAAGDAMASITLSPPQLRPSMIGTTFWLAAVAGQTGTHFATHSSIPIPIEITP